LYGRSGPPGVPGLGGQKGAPGEAGQSGLPGLAGVSGPKGIPGAPGLAGSRGGNGPPGLAGTDGLDAPPGPRPKPKGFFFAMHSQTAQTPDCPRGTALMWDGFSLLHIFGNAYAQGQDLGKLNF